MNNWKTCLLGVTLIIGVPAGAFAEVVSASPSHFIVKTVLKVASEPKDVYQALIHDVGKWWESSHTFSGDSRNLSINPGVGGCFCEKFPSGGGVQHLEVVHNRPGELLRMRGGLGPLQDMAVEGSLTIRISADGETGSTLEWTYRVSGYYESGLDSLAEVVDSVLSTQAERLKTYVETGQPE